MRLYVCPTLEEKKLFVSINTMAFLDNDLMQQSYENYIFLFVGMTDQMTMNSNFKGLS
jgi:hypothetical protein